MHSTPSPIGGRIPTIGRLGSWASRCHAARIHPFVDKNGRTTRLLADLVFAAAQDPTVEQYDWDLDKQRYIALLRAYDAHRDVTDLAAFVGVEPIEP